MSQIVQLLASPVHRYLGRPADGPAPAPPGELVEEVQIRAGLGIVGDRYFGRPAHREASVTLIARESLPPGTDLAQVRRNVLTTGIAVDDLIGAVLILDSGHGPVRLRVHRPRRPAPGWTSPSGPEHWKALRGKGGVRCTPLNDGILRVGPVQVTVDG